MNVDLIAGIVRILTPDGATAGTGFVVSDDGLIVTCAHVVQGAGAGPGDTVRVVFHATGEEREAQVEPAWWRAPDAEDVAILRLDGLLPEGVKPLPLALAADTANHPFETFGFPETNPDEGLWGKGEILRETSIGGVRVLQLQSTQVTPGFSGAPIWDTAIQRVVGLVTAIVQPDQYGRQGETAFATPTEVLRHIWPDLPFSLPDLPSSDDIPVEPYVREAVLAYERHMSGLTRPDMPASPYKFLLPFDLTDQRIFFGRDEAVDSLYDTLLQSRLTVLHARSGAGKSSLLNAGLGPHLLEQGYLPLFARTYNNPVAAIINQIANHGTPPRPRRMSQMPLREFLHLVVENMSRRVPELIIILDQFEELFTQLPIPEERLRYLDALAECVEDDGLRLRFLLAIRGDFFSQLAEFRDRLPGIFHNEFYLKQMRSEEVKEAITGPVKQVAQTITYDKALLETLLAILVGDEMGLPELQILCTHLYEVARRKGVNLIDLELYQEAGGAQGILGGYLTQALGTFPPKARALAWRVLTELVDSLGQRRVVSWEEIGQQIEGDTVSLNKVLDQLLAARLVQRAEGGRYDLAHDYLAATIWERLGQEDLALKQIKDLLGREVASWQINRTLISRERLTIITEHRHRLINLGPEETALLFRSAVAHQFAVDTWALAAHQRGVDIWPILQPALTARDYRLRAKVITVLSVVGGAALPVLKQALADEAPLVRVQAILALERIGTGVAHQALESGLRYEIHIPSLENDPAFYIDRYPVTNEAYELFLQHNPDHEPPPSWSGRSAPQRLLNHPVVNVSWADATAYAAWAGKRLPTVIEWERTAGDQQGRRYPWGNQFSPDFCNTREAGMGHTTPVGYYSPQGDSLYGAADMAGNVWEWLAEEAGLKGEYHQLRGGAWFYSAEFARIDYDHFWRKPDYRQDTIGFRLCFDAP